MDRFKKLIGVALYHLIFVTDILLTAFTAFLIGMTVSKELFYGITTLESRYFWYGLLGKVQIVCMACGILSLVETEILDNMRHSDLERVVSSKNAVRRLKRFHVEHIILWFATVVHFYIEYQVLGGDGHTYSGDPWLKEIGFKATSIFVLLMFEKAFHGMALKKIQEYSKENADKP